MEIYEYKFFNKNAITIIYLSKIFLHLKIGDKVPTFEVLSKEIDVARGTVQNSFKTLHEEKAIKTITKGHMGTFLLEKDTPKLLKLANIRFLMGTMVLPYSKTYEGLATGLVTALQNKYNLAVNMAYMCGAIPRIDMLEKGRYDFAIVSRFSAEYAIHKGKNIEIIVDFGLKTYLSAHVIVFSNPYFTDIEDGMKIGVVKNYENQKRMTVNSCYGKNVEFIEMEYDQILKSLNEGMIDATVWNKDKIDDILMKTNFKPIDDPNPKHTMAVLVVDKNRQELVSLLKEIVNINTVKSIQKEVILNKRVPKY